MQEGHLGALRSRRPETPTYLDSSRTPGRLDRAWNLIVPGPLANVTLAAELSELRPAAPLGVHAGRLAAWLERWWARSRDREQVLQLLAGWAASGAGYPFSLAEASDELADAFAATPTLEGTLADPTVRVLSPMALLGGSFDVVVLPGLAHARFPVEPKESPLLQIGRAHV